MSFLETLNDYIKIMFLTVGNLQVNFKNFKILIKNKNLI